MTTATLTAELRTTGIRRANSWLAWLGFALCLLGTRQLTPLFAKPDRSLRDFVQEWTSVRNWQVGRPVYQDLRESIPFHLPKARAGDLHFNAHPPAAVLIALPFGSQGYWQSLRSWNIASLACIAVALWAVMGRCGFGLLPSEKLLVAGVVLSSSVLQTQVLHGQLNGVLFALLTLAWLADRQTRSVAAGICVGIAASLKLFPGFLVLYFLARRRWKAAFAAAGSFLMLNAITAGILGLDAFRDYLTIVMPQANRFADTWPNASLLGYLTRLFDASFGQTTPIWHAPMLARIAWIGLSGVGIAITWRVTARLPKQHADGLAFATWIGLMLLVSPITWDHYFLLAVVPLIALWKGRSLTVPTSHAFVVCAALLLVILSPYTVWRFIVPGYAHFGMTPAVATPIRMVTVVSFQFYIAAALFVFSLRRMQFETPANR